MAGYSRRWACEVCSAAMESVDWPEEAICDRCERKREWAADADAIRICAARVYLAPNHQAFELKAARRAAEVAERLERQSR